MIVAIYVIYLYVTILFFPTWPSLPYKYCGNAGRGSKHANTEDSDNLPHLRLTKCIEYEHRGDATQISAISSGGLHRCFNNCQIQLTAVGGTIGTGLCISICGAVETKQRKYLQSCSPGTRTCFPQKIYKKGHSYLQLPRHHAFPIPIFSSG